LNAPFLLYGAYGFVGEPIARRAVEMGLTPVLAGRDGSRVERLAAELGTPFRIFSLDNTAALEHALNEVAVVLHCAGPYLHTAKPMVDACLRTGTHYLDLTGEIPVYQAIAARDAEARERGVMLLPAVGFDVAPTDCLALHLKERLPTATHLTLAFQARGSAGLPPGTQRTAIELFRFGDRVRRGGALVSPTQPGKTRHVDFGRGPVEVTLFTWGDVFTAYYSTGIPNIEVYTVIPPVARRLMGAARLARPLFRVRAVRELATRLVRPGRAGEARARATTHVWGEVTDEAGGIARARLHGPEAGVVWTAHCALAAVQRVLAGAAPSGYQTPARAYGADFVLEDAVTREDIL
jgi:short subunit dehydrogenase-like uncharacterized protein